MNECLARCARTLAIRHVPLSSRCIVAFAAVAICGCTTKGKVADPEPEAGRSPTAAIRPAPLETIALLADDLDASARNAPAVAPSDSRSRGWIDAAAGIVSTALTASQPLPLDAQLSREMSGMSLSAEWTWPNVIAAAHTPETVTSAIDAARKSTRKLWQIDLSDVGRMRVAFDSPAFVIARGSELRSRYDRYGHALVWPHAELYRPIPIGSLRALLGDRRVDITPLVTARTQALPSPSGRAGFATNRTQVSTATGTLMIDQAQVPASGLGGPLLCRLLVELVSADPSTPVCAPGLLPLHAEYSWGEGVGIVFDVAVAQARSNLTIASVATPPASASFVTGGLPSADSPLLVTQTEFAAFRSRSIELPRARNALERKTPLLDGFVADNGSDELRYVLVDGVPVAWIAPHHRENVPGALRGRYQVQWRNFFGSQVSAARIVEFPTLLRADDTIDGGIENVSLEKTK